MLGLVARGGAVRAEREDDDLRVFAAGQELGEQVLAGGELPAHRAVDMRLREVLLQGLCHGRRDRIADHQHARAALLRGCIAPPARGVEVVRHYERAHLRLRGILGARLRGVGLRGRRRGLGQLFAGLFGRQREFGAQLHGARMGDRLPVERQHEHQHGERAGDDAHHGARAQA